VEAGVTRWWSQYGCDAAMGVDNYGESGPGGQICAHFGLTPERLADLVEAEVNGTGAIVRSSN
jgi:transketolase